MKEQVEKIVDKPLRKVRFKVAWGNYKPGDEITPTGVHREWLLQCGYVVPVDQETIRDKGTHRQIGNKKSGSKKGRKPGKKSTYRGIK